MALQEVLCASTGATVKTIRLISSRADWGFNYCMGHNRELRRRLRQPRAQPLPAARSENHDISVAGREERGCLRVDVDLGKESRLHVYNVHLGTSFIERRQPGAQTDQRIHPQRRQDSGAADYARRFQRMDSRAGHATAERAFSDRRHTIASEAFAHLSRSCCPICISITSTSTKRWNWNTPNCIAAARRCSLPIIYHYSPISA